MRLFSTIVLAGGASARMGSPKALLRFGGETLVERVAGRMCEVSAEVLVVGGPHVEFPPLPRGVRVVRDDPPLRGPLSGIHYGLRAATTDLCFVCGCDHPFLAPALARLLVGRVDEDGAISVWRGREQPLVAAYRRGVGEIAAGLIAAGERRALALLEHARLTRVAEIDLLCADPSERSFLDVDTPEAYARALRLFDAERDPRPAQGVSAGRDS